MLQISVIIHIIHTTISALWHILTILIVIQIITIFYMPVSAQITERITDSSSFNGKLQSSNSELTHIVIVINIISILGHVPWWGRLGSWKGPGGLQGGACDGRVL